MAFLDPANDPVLESSFSNGQEPGSIFRDIENGNTISSFIQIY